MHRLRDPHHCGPAPQPFYPGLVWPCVWRIRLPRWRNRPVAMPMAWNGLGCDTRRPNPGERCRTGHRELHVEDCNGCPLVGEREILCSTFPQSTSPGKIPWSATARMWTWRWKSTGKLEREWTCDGSIVNLLIRHGWRERRARPHRCGCLCSAENLCASMTTRTLTINPTIEISPSSNIADSLLDTRMRPGVHVLLGRGPGARSGFGPTGWCKTRPPNAASFNLASWIPSWSSTERTASRQACAPTQQLGPDWS